MIAQMDCNIFKSYGDIYNGRFQSENNHKWTIISICTFILKCHVLLIILIKTREM
jgi:hypothetical protein